MREHHVKGRWNDTGDKRLKPRGCPEDSVCVSGHPLAEGTGKSELRGFSLRGAITRGSTALYMGQKLRFAGNPQN